MNQVRRTFRLSTDISFVPLPVCVLNGSNDTGRFSIPTAINSIFWNSNLDGCNPIGWELIAPYRETRSFLKRVHSSACNVSRYFVAVEISRSRLLSRGEGQGWEEGGGGGDLRLSFDRCSVKSCHANGVRASKRTLNFFLCPLPTLDSTWPIRNARITIIGCVWFHLLFSQGVVSGWVGSSGRVGRRGVGIYRLPPRVYIRLRGIDVV